MNFQKVLVIAPHPDDETLGCGGTILRHIAEKSDVYWLIATAMTTGRGYTEESIGKRQQEINSVAASYGFNKVYQAGFPAAGLDSVPMAQIVSFIGDVVNEVRPDTIYVPYRNDIHSDHTVVFDAAAACSKTFRYPFVKRLYCYETLSETEFSVRPDMTGFKPNRFVDISLYIEMKIKIMSLYHGEILDFPFPRSEKAVRALAEIRGIVAGVSAAEAFMVIKEII